MFDSKCLFVTSKTQKSNKKGHSFFKNKRFIIIKRKLALYSINQTTIINGIIADSVQIQKSKRKLKKRSRVHTDLLKK